MLIRYFYDAIFGNNQNQPNGNHWIQLAAFRHGRSNDIILDPNSNVALNKPASVLNISGSYANQNASGGRALGAVLNGTVDTTKYFTIDSNGKVGIKVDLGAVYDIEYIHVWHYFGDKRIYFQHEIKVSLDGVNWITIQQPQGNTREKDSGNKYYLLNQIDEKLLPSRIYSVRAAVNAARNRRWKSDNSFYTNVSGKAYVNVVQEIKDILKNQYDGVAITIPYLGERIDKDEALIQYVNAYQQNASCNSGCVQVCRTECSGVCGGECSGGCRSACSVGCGGDCNGGCSSACYSGCGDTCSKGCGTFCTFRCENKCYDHCASPCVGFCSNRWCQVTCTGVCSSGCGWGCGAGCESSCSGQCDNECTYPGCQWSCFNNNSNGPGGWKCTSSNCVNTCDSWCEDRCSSSRCYSACHVGCGGACDGGCSSACSTGCGNSCSAMCGKFCSNGCDETCIGSNIWRIQQ